MERAAFTPEGFGHISSVWQGQHKGESNNMKSALIITGQPRTMEFCYPSLKRHILDVYKPDVFLVSDAEESRMIELFNPVRIDIRRQEEIDIRYKTLRLRYTAPDREPVAAKDLSCAWKVYRASQLKQDFESRFEFIYDVVLITRFDVKFHCVPEIKTPEPNTLHIPRRGAYWITPPDKPGIHWHGYSAHLCWMPSPVADQLAGIYFQGEDNFKIASEVAEWGYIPEHVTKNYCDRAGIRAVFEDMDMMLIRGTNEAPLSFQSTPLKDYPDYL